MSLDTDNATTYLHKELPMVKGSKPYIQPPSWEPPLSKLSASDLFIYSHFPRYLHLKPTHRHSMLQWEEKHCWNLGTYTGMNVYYRGGAKRMHN
jgi:hypothetical protein